MKKQNSSTQISLRNVKLEDAPEIINLICQLSNVASQKDIMRNIRYYIYDPSYMAMVAESEGRIVGLIAMHYITLLHRSQNMARIMELIVDNDHRRNGIGKMLVERAEKWAIKQKCDAIELTTSIRRKPTGTYDFYDELGYKNEGDDEKMYLRKYIIKIPG